MFECESSRLKSFRSGLDSSFTIGRNEASLFESCSCYGVTEVGFGDEATPLYLRLDVKDREEPRFDFDDLFLLYFMRLLI